MVQNLNKHIEYFYCKGVEYIWNDIKKLINRELLSIGVGTRQLSDYRTAISSIVRRTYGYKSITDIPSDNEEVELFVLELLNSIKERRGKEWKNATTSYLYQEDKEEE